MKQFSFLHFAQFVPYFLEHDEGGDFVRKRRLFIYSSLIVFLLVLPLINTSTGDKNKSKEDLSQASLSLSTAEKNDLKSLDFTEKEINIMSLEEYEMNKGHTDIR